MTTPTGRSSAPPHLQNIPVRTELGREIRNALLPQALPCADYSQIERKVLEHFEEPEPPTIRRHVEPLVGDTIECGGERYEIGRRRSHGSTRSSSALVDAVLLRKDGGYGAPARIVSFLISDLALIEDVGEGWWRTWSAVKKST
jgi:hypothetical protein